MSYNLKSITNLIFFGITKFKKWVKKGPKSVKNSLFKKVPQAGLFGRVIPMQNFFNGCDSYTFISTFSESFKSWGPHMQKICQFQSGVIYKSVAYKKTCR